MLLPGLPGGPALAPPTRMEAAPPPRAAAEAPLVLLVAPQAPATGNAATAERFAVGETPPHVAFVSPFSLTPEAPG